MRPWSLSRGGGLLDKRVIMAVVLNANPGATVSQILQATAREDKAF